MGVSAEICLGDGHVCEGVGSGWNVGCASRRLTAAELGNRAAPAVAAAAATATLRSAIVAADLRTEYLELFVSSSTMA